MIVPSAFARERLRELGAPLPWERVHVLRAAACATLGAPVAAADARRRRLRARRLAPGAGEGRRRGDRRLPDRRHPAGGRRRRAASVRSSAARGRRREVRFVGRVDDAELARAARRRGDRAGAVALGRDVRPGGGRGDGGGLAGRGEPRRRAAGAASTREALVPRRATRDALARGDRAARRRSSGRRARARERVRALWRPEVVAAGAGAGRTTGDDARARGVSSGRVPVATRPDHRHHRPGRLVPGGAAAREGLQRHRPGARRRASGRSAAPSTCASSVELVRGDLLEPGTPARGDRAGAPARDLPPGGALVRARLVGAAGRDDCRRSWARRRRSSRRCASSSRDARVFVAASGAIFGDAPESPQREDTPCRPTDALRDRQARRAPARGRAARARRAARELGDRLQPRVRAPARAVRDAQDHPRRGRDRARACRTS